MALDMPPPDAPTASTFRRLLPGDPMPWLSQACGTKDEFAFDTFAGRYQLFCFFLSAADPSSQKALQAVSRRRAMFDDQHCSFVGVSLFPHGRDVLQLRNLEPGVRFAWDFDHKVARTCGAAPLQSVPGAPVAGRRFWMLVDPTLHVLRVFPFEADNADEVLDAVAAQPPPARFGGVSIPAPILLLPNVFEPEFCRSLIDEYDRHGGEESGVHRRGQGVHDASFKRRKDHTLTDQQLRDGANARIGRRVLPEVEKLFFMRAGFIERHIVGCYAAEDGGHFAPHRDNRQGLTAHRRFAVSINLNGDFQGGEVVFPEYNTDGYKAPPGWAVVFPCAILHQVRPVTRGARYAFLPFIYDETGRDIREAALAEAASQS